MKEAAYLKLGGDLVEAEKRLYGTNEPFALAQLTYPGYISSGRGVMFAAHLKQYVEIKGPEVPKLMTGGENLLGKLCTAYNTADGNYRVIAKVSKYSWIPNHAYTLFVEDVDTGEYAIIEKKNLENLTEKFGYEYDNRVIDSKSEGSMITKGEVLTKTYSYDEDMNFMYGKNLTVMYTSDPDTIEDAIKCSQSAANSMISTEVETVNISINDNDVLTNHYGNKNIYKPFPDIGEEIKDHIVCCKRRKYNNQVLYDFKNSNLRDVNFNGDTPLYNAGGIVDDIVIYCNKAIEDIQVTPFNEQLIKYLKEQNRYWTEILYWCGHFIEKDKTKCSRDINYYYNRASKITQLGTEYQWKTEDSAFSNMIIEITVYRQMNLTIGGKITGRAGNKGVISKVVPDEEMPFILLPDGTKKYVDLLLNCLGVINRSNPQQLYELELNHFSSAIAFKMGDTNIPLTEREKDFFDYFKICNPKEYIAIRDYYKSLKTETRKEEFMKNVRDQGIITHIPPFWMEKGFFQILRELKARYKWICQDNVHIHKWGRDIKILRPTTIGELYFIKLKQTSKKNFSSRSLAGIGLSNVPTKSNRAKVHLELYPKTPVRLGVQESMNMFIGVEPEIVSDLTRFYRSSPSGRRALASELMSTTELEKFPEGEFNNINVEMLDAYLKVQGFVINFHDEFEHVLAKDDDSVQTHMDGDEIFIGNEWEYNMHNIEKDIRRRYTDEDCFIGTPEEYERMISEETEKSFNKLFK